MAPDRQWSSAAPGRSQDQFRQPYPGRPVAPAVPVGIRVYAVGDVHGRLDLLRQVFAGIDEQDRLAPVASTVEIYLGDFIDRGPQSRAVIDHLIARAQTRELYPLLGNHEDLMLKAGSDFAMAETWLRLGGVETLLSYGASSVEARQVENVPLLMSRLIPPQHFAFLSSLPLEHRIGDYFFVHAGVRPGFGLDQQSRHDRLWIREPFLDSTEWLGAMIVHGHSPTPRPVFRTNRIGLDTGAFVTGNLTCLVLEEDRQFLLSAPKN